MAFQTEDRHCFYAERAGSGVLLQVRILIISEKNKRKKGGNAGRVIRRQRRPAVYNA